MRKTVISTLAGLIARVRINDVNRIVYCKRIYFRKSRYWFSPFVVWGANLVLAVLGIRARFLSLNRWTHCERDVYRFFYNEDVFIGPDDSVYVPARPGICLADFLQDPLRTDGEKDAAVGAAAAALLRLHMNVLPHVGRTDVLSHGDATALNVIYDPAVDSAQWIDFETAHAERISLIDRHADDLQTFILSILTRSDPGVLSGRLAAIFRNYTEGEIWFTVLNTLEQENWNMIFHMARTRVGWQQYKDVKGQLLTAIPRLLAENSEGHEHWVRQEREETDEREYF